MTKTSARGIAVIVIPAIVLGACSPAEQSQGKVRPEERNTGKSSGLRG